MSDNRQPRKLNTRAAQGSERKVYRAPAPEQSRHRPEPGRSAYSAQESAGTAHRRKAKKKKKKGGCLKIFLLLYIHFICSILRNININF